MKMKIKLTSKTASTNLVFRSEPLADRLSTSHFG
jgi:hypothetical protein